MVFSEDDYDGYFLWLCDLVNADMTRYSELLFRLHDMDFVWCLEQDESRAVEGLMLREEYYGLTDYLEDWVMFMDKKCSVLESLIALARRMSDAMTETESGDTTRVWFWMFIKNLGLKPYSNIRLEAPWYPTSESDLIDIQMIVHRWLNREFESDGVGSIFPLKEARHDQRERTLVYQMYDYIFENFVEK